LTDFTLESVNETNRQGSNVTVPNAAVIVAAVNAEETIGEQLAALCRQAGAGSFEVIVVDNGSTDGTVEIVETWAAGNPNIRLVEASGRTSAGYARNQGARATRADVLLFTDSDDVVSETWVSSMVAALDCVHLVGGAVDESSLNSAEVLAWTKPRSNTLEVAHSFLPHAIGTNLGFRRDVFWAIGGWAESFSRAASEDIEICWRAQMAGFELGESPESIVKYRHRHTLASVARQYFRRGRNDQALCRAYIKLVAAEPSPDIARVSSPLNSVNPGPKRAQSVVAVACAIAGALPRVLTSIEARGSIVRQLASGLGWMVERASFAIRGPGPTDTELEYLLAGIRRAGDIEQPATGQKTRLA